MIQQHPVLNSHCWAFLIIWFISHAPLVLADTHSPAKSTIVYKFVDEKGVLHLTNKPPSNNEAVLYSRSYVVQSYQPPPLPRVSIPIYKPYKPIAPLLSSPSPSPKNTDYAILIDTVALRVGLQSALLHAVVKAESGYNPNAVSPKGAVGLMQLMPDTAKRYGVTNRQDATMNLEGGARYLRELLTLFKGDLSLALAGYNAGENAVIQAGNQIPPYPETKAYVTRVMALYRHYLNMSSD